METGSAEAIPKVFLLNGEGQWEAAIHPLNRYSTIRKGLGMQKVGPGGSFAKSMSKAYPDHSIGLVVNAKGGSRIDQWKKGGKFYNDAVRRAKSAQESGTLRGILWHQGESDAGKPEGYLEKLVELIENLRGDLQDPDLPFVAGEINKVPLINDQISRLPSKVKHTAFISSKDLKTTDRWHFDASSVKLMGERYAEEMIRLLGK